jgi:hypothetical protein
MKIESIDQELVECVPVVVHHDALKYMRRTFFCIILVETSIGDAIESLTCLREGIDLISVL